MASIAASTAAASLGMSEMLGNPVKFSGATRSIPSSSTPSTFKTVALFQKKKAAPPPKQKAVTPASEELAKWYGKSPTMFCSHVCMCSLTWYKDHIVIKYNSCYISIIFRLIFYCVIVSLH